MEPFLDDGDQNVDRDSDPNLSFDGVLGSPVKSLDSQVLFDPAKEQFHLPTTAIQLGNG
jgi:hypothetical protein